MPGGALLCRRRWPIVIGVAATLDLSRSCASGRHTAAAEEEEAAAAAAAAAAAMQCRVQGVSSPGDGRSDGAAGSKQASSQQASSQEGSSVDSAGRGPPFLPDSARAAGLAGRGNRNRPPRLCFLGFSDLTEIAIFDRKCPGLTAPALGPPGHRLPARAPLGSHDAAMDASQGLLSRVNRAQGAARPPRTAPR